MTRVYVVTYKSEQQDEILDRAYLDIEEAKSRVVELEEAFTHTAHVGIVPLDLIRPREWTEEQRRWMRGAS